METCSVMADNEVTYLRSVRFFVHTCFKECKCTTVLRCYCYSDHYEQIINGSVRCIIAVLSRSPLPVPVPCYSAVLGYGHIAAAL